MNKHLVIALEYEKVFVFFPTIAFGECQVNNTYWAAFIFGPFRLKFKLSQNANNIAQD
jgi:hypothetical protein